MEIGHFIKNIRIKKNMSQETLSKNIISRRNLSKIENNETSPTIEQLKQIFFKLNIDSNDINDFVLNFNSSQYNELHTEFTDLINSVNIKNSDLLLLNQKIKEDLSSDRKIISLYLEFKIRFKNNKLILPLTTKEIRNIYDYLVASPVYTINDYTILALLVKLAPIPMIEHLHSKMFPVQFRELRNQGITDVILCFYFNITSELIQLQWHSSAKEYLALAKIELTPTNYYYTLKINYLEKLQLYSETRKLEYKNQCLELIEIPKKFDDIKLFELLKKLLSIVDTQNENSNKSFFK
ncbi:hypothetical protein CKN63_13235 [Carnobacterium divergens]|uniref:helix-turn-helix domain-containing protein n=1 Tax=Carnobacterium divergens TaxID=2748 RepID=UPI0010729BDD|nr:helix-turn-helix transcriptional regulator [Carnobacterium divergens]TFI60524.1 hypothetical protein CKN59_13170 [Carnobacterium divergens]TFI61676.1 hypothetical protein CKN76_12815 [Carnobacterium divergens]TFJ00999.1 hypothetical protein CKN75_12760 [Carnobacterium divergens]TFJ08919.1 hypothetical protein CKN71_12775 [Carnobacterium divergens]TFJ15628.1 hypothetical protein CKN63_13235 [Carnobacterium divergens]